MGVKKQVNYDVVVVGAGPAGLMASRKAAEKGLKVLLVEAERRLGFKVCGEAVSKGTLEDAEVTPHQSFICNRIDGACVYAPNENKKVEIVGDFGGYILDKPAFLRKLASYAIKVGVDFWINSKVFDVKHFEEGYEVYVKNFGEILTVKCRFIVGCDGVNSIIARKFFDRSNYKLISCIQYKMVNCKFEDPHKLEFYFGREVAPLGYAWIFPKDEYTANVGIGVRGVPAKKYLDKFIEKHPDKFKNAKIVEVGGAPVPIGGEIGKVVDAENGIIVCGDAAGQVIPLTGGGIHSSIVAGKVAGEVLAEHVNGNLSLDEYPKRYSYWSERIMKSLKVLKVLENLSDQELNQLAEVLTGEDIIDLANGLNIRRVALKLLKHPVFALRLAKALMG